MVRHQEIKYCTTSDDVRLAYSIIGKGTPMVRTPHWFAHLENDLKGPIFSHQVLGLAHHHTLLRYDGRGLGLSQRDVREFSLDRAIEDLDTVTKSAGINRFILIGLSQGGATAIAYASRYPERVSHLIICGGFARGMLHRGQPEKQKEALELASALIRQGWGGDDDAYREFFTSQFIPDGTIEDHRRLNHIQRVAAAPEIAERILRNNANINVADLLPTIRVPTLVMHCRGDLRVPFDVGQEIAGGIPNAKFVLLESRNHMILANEPANRQFFDAIASFLGEPPIRGPLPGTATIIERLERSVGTIERNWLVKVIVILAAITGVAIFLVEMWKLFEHG
jgi:pimeloyl-ACP methyl ester carboxylesterase